MISTQITPSKILIIRRDNIGDLLCVTPSIRALKNTYPGCNVTLLVNSYNRDVIANNPDINKIEVYTKAKHKESHVSLFLIFLKKFKMILRLRRSKFDYVIIASASERVRDWRLAKLCKPKSIIGYLNNKKGAKKEDIALDVENKNSHEVERVFNLFKQVGVHGIIPPMQLYPSDNINIQDIDDSRRVIGINISTRKESQRWPLKNFFKLIKELSKNQKFTFLIFWSPGSRDNPKHPGDDENAIELIKLCKNLPVNLYPETWRESNTLQELIDGLSLCDYVVTPDGGAMHISAALQKPIVCFFGDVDIQHWYPWGVKYKLLQAKSYRVKDISIDQAVNSVIKLINT
ncbi:glycosyltransferase family 9 protein [Candidatus Woesearchaeota archaeon]|nr:glycosyltransferase family 9 protein [Candidatus Woesearchaeota archaeon]MBT7558326.1 glycosyltransferase family 9 protein [Candidatus Woesearchaeota archaeon]